MCSLAGADTRAARVLAGSCVMLRMCLCVHDRVYLRTCVFTLVRACDAVHMCACLRARVWELAGGGCVT